MRLAWAAPAVLLLLAGCLGAGVEQSGSVLEGLDDLPMAQSASVYWEAPNAGELYAERSVRHLGGGPTSGSLQFHTLEEVGAHLAELNATYPGLVELRVLTTSALGRPVWDLVVTDESVDPAGKLVPILDGAHHGNEYAGGELMLYAVDLLLENHASNATVRRLLTELEIHVVPVVNPDGWVAATRYNGNGVNLNRNYDIDWGNPLGTSNPAMGTVGALSGQPLGGVALAAENCGAAPFSEPETQALRDLMLATADRAAFYLTGHTATHAVIAPWAAFQSPGPLPPAHHAVLESELQWVRDNSEYQAGKAQWGNLSAGLPYAASGSSMDWYYVNVERPAFTIEVEYEVTSATSPDYPTRLTQPFEGLRFWMENSVQFPMHLLANAAGLARWEPPSEPALVPAAELPEWLVPAAPAAHL